jgi:replicative DNA helicase
MTGNYVTAGQTLAGLRDDLFSGRKPVRWPLGNAGLGKIDFGPGSVLLLGGAPGAGKTALVGQMIFDALRLNEELSAVIGNVEMSPAVLLERQLARVSGIPLGMLRERQVGAAEAERLERGIATLEPLCERLTFLKPPFSLQNLADTSDAQEADLIVCDYVQRFEPPEDAADARRAMGAIMSMLRQFAETGCGVVVVSALGRSKDSRGRASYSEGLGLASFRETSELEYGADDAYILAEGKEEGQRILRHLKSRNGARDDLELSFDGRLQRFKGAEGDTAGGPNLQASLAARWAATVVAAADGGEEGAV